MTRLLLTVSLVREVRPDSGSREEKSTPSPDPDQFRSESSRLCNFVMPFRGSRLTTVEGTRSFTISVIPASGVRSRAAWTPFP